LVSRFLYADLILRIINMTILWKLLKDAYLKFAMLKTYVALIWTTIEVAVIIHVVKVFNMKKLITRIILMKRMIVVAMPVIVSVAQKFLWITCQQGLQKLIYL
jgi:hypothetical protein